MPRLTSYDVLSLDCYGTLIDWETGIHSTLTPWLERAGLKVDREPILEAFARHEAAQEAETPSLLYPEILAQVHRRLAKEWNISCRDEDTADFATSVRHWPAFPDSAPALRYLKNHYRLVILSNVDNDSFSYSRTKLGVEFDAVFTAEDIGSYKPDLQNFEYMLRALRRLGIGQSRVLHTAQSLFHDHIPATQLGLATNWIDRRHALDGWGATVPPNGAPRIDFSFTSMEELVEAHRLACL